MIYYVTINISNKKYTVMQTSIKKLKNEVCQKVHEQNSTGRIDDPY